MTIKLSIIISFQCDPCVLKSTLGWNNCYFQRYTESAITVSMLQQTLVHEKEQLQELKEEVKRAKAAKAREEQRETENVSPNPEGMLGGPNWHFRYHARLVFLLNFRARVLQRAQL